MNINAIKQRLNSLQNTSKKTDALWKPKPGKYTIRIVPYKFNLENPFIELLFHYNINNKTYLSPASFERPDPILEFAEKLKRLGDTENWKAGKKMEPKLRTFAPIVVRGAESEGVKFWGFGKTVYEEVLAIISDPDYGDITDAETGRDVVIEIVEAEGKTYPETRIRVKPNVTKLSDNPETLTKLLNDQKEITDIYSELSYAELKGVLENWLNPTAPTDEADSPAPSVASESLAPKPQSVQEQVAPQPVAVPKSAEPITELPWDVADEKPASTKVDVASAFEDLFNS